MKGGIKMKEINQQANLQSKNIKSIEIKEAYKISKIAHKEICEAIHDEFSKNNYSVKIMELDAIKLADYIISHGCTNELIETGRTLLSIQKKFSNGQSRCLGIPPLTDKLFKLGIKREIIIWFTSVISEFYNRMQNAKPSGQTIELRSTEEQCYKQLYKFFSWCNKQGVSLDYINHDGLQKTMMEYLNRNSYVVKSSCLRWLEMVFCALELRGFPVNKNIFKSFQRIKLEEGFPKELNEAVKEFLSIKSTAPKTYYIDGYGKIPSTKIVSRWRKSTQRQAKECIYNAYKHYCEKRGIPRSQVTLWALQKDDIETVPCKHTTRWWSLLENWFGYLYNRTDTPEPYKEEILKILTHPPGLEKYKKGKNPVFLTPLEMVLIEKQLEKISLDKHAMRNKVMFLLGCLTGLRPGEITQITLNMFERDPKTGLLKLYGEENYSILRLPTEASKGGYSPSHPEYGTIVLPYLVKVINKYLNSPAMKGAIEAASHGKDVYLVHKGAHWTNGKLHNNAVKNLFQRYKEKLSKCLMHHPAGTTFSAHDLRHSCNDLILNLAFYWRSNVRIAETHLRHNPDRRSSSVNIRHYSRDISKSAYYNAVLHALNFPWDEMSVKEWMEKRGYNVKTGELPDEISFSLYPQLLSNVHLNLSPIMTSPIAPTIKENNMKLNSIGEIEKIVDELKRKQKQIISDHENGIINKTIATQRFRLACEEAIDKLNDLGNNAQDETFKYACAATIKNIHKSINNYKISID